LVARGLIRGMIREDISMIDGRIHEEEEIPVNPKDNN
jgi:hypothetical protein